MKNNLNIFFVFKFEGEISVASTKLVLEYYIFAGSKLLFDIGKKKNKNKKQLC